MGLLDSTPPEQLTGKEPPSSVEPSSIIVPPSPGSAMRWPSNQMASCQENGT